MMRSRPRRRRLLLLPLVSFFLLFEEEEEALGEESSLGEMPSPPTDPIADDPPSSSNNKPAPYSLPWQLRPAAAVNAVRSDTSMAFQDVGATLVSFLSGSAKIRSDVPVAVGVRYGFVHDVSNAGSARSAFTNLALSATWASSPAPTSGPFRFAVTGGVVIPNAQGGGGAPNQEERKAIGAGVLTRSAMDNAMFAANDLGLFGGGAIAYVADGLTVQIEATIFELFRVKGEARQKEASKMNSTWGAHVGLFLTPWLSIGTELRYQVFLMPPPQIDPERRDAVTAALGFRAHFTLNGYAFRPGVSYTHPLDDPMAASGYRIAQLDLPFIF